MVSKMIQLDFFKTEEECELDYIKQELKAVAESSTKVRKGTYARLNEIAKENYELKSRLEILERFICTGEK